MGDEQNTFDSPDGGAKIGPVLEQARKERGLTLNEVEQATKIRKRYLSGLEREDYGVLPDAVYAQGFLKTYANYLGLDGEELSRQLRNRRKPRRERGINYGPPRKSEFERPLISPGGLDGTRKRSISGTTVVTLVVAVFALAAVIGALYYVGRGVQTSDGNQEGSPRSAGEERLANGSKPDGGGAPAEEAREGKPAGGGSGGDEAAGDPPSSSSSSRQQPDSLRIEVSVEGAPSWLRILADGNVAYEQIAQPGFTQTFEARREVILSTGNAGAVNVAVNGQDVGRLGESGEVVLNRSWILKTAS